MMKPKFVVCISTVLLATLLYSPGFSETIHLLDGRVLKEKITENNSRYILTVDERKMRHKYYHGEIDFIEEDEQENVDSETNSEVVVDENVSSEKVELIKTFIDVSGVRSQMKQNLEHVVSKAAKEQREDYSELLDVDAIIKRLVPVYSKYYSMEDLSALIQFYESPAGQRTLKVTPLIMQETVKVGVQYIQEKVMP